MTSSDRHEHVLPQEFTLSKSFIELGELLVGGRDGETRRERASSVRVSYSARIVWLDAPKAALQK